MNRVKSQDYQHFQKTDGHLDTAKINIEEVYVSTLLNAFLTHEDLTELRSKSFDKFKKNEDLEEVFRLDP